MADFLTRLAGRTLGLAATVQPIIAPMYAAGQQFVGAEDVQAGVQDTWGATNREMGAINRAPTAGYGQREVSLQDGPPDEPPPGNLVGQTVQVPDMLLPPVPQGNQPSMAQVRHKIPGAQPEPGDSTSLERGEAEFSAGQVHMLRPAALSSRAAGEAIAGTISLEQSRSPGPQFRRAMDVPEAEERNRQPQGIPVRETGIPPYPTSTPPLREESEVGHDGRRKRPHPTSAPPPPLREESEAGHDGRPQGSPPHPAPALPLREAQGRPLEATLVPPVMNILSVQGLTESKAVRPRQDGSQVGSPGHPYNQGNQHDVAPVTQEPSAPVPTIQVTIGRIEVRAAPPPAPRAQPQRSGPPVMGLEEYLKQRAKGGY
jgi:hypothetical protein